MSRALLPTELRRRPCRKPDMTMAWAETHAASSLRELNSRPSPYHGDALPTELREHPGACARRPFMMPRGSKLPNPYHAASVALARPTWRVGTPDTRGGGTGLKDPRDEGAARRLRRSRSRQASACGKITRSAGARGPGRCRGPSRTASRTGCAARCACRTRQRLGHGPRARRRCGRSPRSTPGPRRCRRR